MNNELVKRLREGAGLDTQWEAASVIEAMEKDAARYRWLRARWCANTDEDIEQHTDAMNADDPDAAIDAAIEAHKEKAHE